MSGYAAQLRDSSKALTDGNAQMKAGVTQLSESIGKMNTAAGTLTGNNKALNDGSGRGLGAITFRKVRAGRVHHPDGNAERQF